MVLDWLRGKPKCPVDAESKAWIEKRFTWLTVEFGFERLTSGRTMLPTEEFLPLDYECTEEGIQDLMCRVANFMEVDPDSLELNYYQDDTPQFDGAPHHGTAGLFESADGHFKIWLEEKTLADPAGVIATLAHEIGHVILIGQNHIDPEEEEDHEPLTDLLTVFLGLGIFPANSAVHENNWSSGGWSGWSVGRRGYLSMNMFGYAMALYTLARGDARPAWAIHLRPDAKAALKQGIRYILETEDCAFLPAVKCAQS